MDKKHQKCPKNGVLPPFATPQIFFQKSGSVTFVPLWCPNFMQKLEKTNEQSLRYLKTDTRTDGRTHGQGRLLRTPSGKPGVQNHINILGLYNVFDLPSEFSEIQISFLPFPFLTDSAKFQTPYLTTPFQNYL